MPSYFSSNVHYHRLETCPIQIHPPHVYVYFHCCTYCFRESRLFDKLLKNQNSSSRSVVQVLYLAGRRTRSLPSRTFWQRFQRRKRMIAIIISRYSVAHYQLSSLQFTIMHATYRSKPSQARNLISGIETNVCSAERRINSTCDTIANITRPNTMTNIAIFRSRVCLLRFLGYFPPRA